MGIQEKYIIYQVLLKLFAVCWKIDELPAIETTTQFIGLIANEPNVYEASTNGGEWYINVRLVVPVLRNSITALNLNSNTLFSTDKFATISLKNSLLPLFYISPHICIISKY
jgi:hypothetical protein